MQDRAAFQIFDIFINNYDTGQTCNISQHWWVIGYYHLLLSNPHQPPISQMVLTGLSQFLSVKRSNFVLCLVSECNIRPSVLISNYGNTSPWIDMILSLWRTQAQINCAELRMKTSLTVELPQLNEKLWCRQFFCIRVGHFVVYYVKVGVHIFPFAPCEIS